MGTTTFCTEELNEIYEGMTRRVIARCVLTTRMAGGQPAGDAELKAFAAHHLHLEGDELEKAVERIRSREVETAETANGEGELKEVDCYGLNIIRRDSDGVRWIGNWQIKAMLKQAASRCNLFVKKRGTKGDMSEMGRIHAIGKSLGDDPTHIRLVNADGTPFGGGHYEKFMGRVNTPQGSKSIVHDSEIAPPGCWFEFELRMPMGQKEGEKKLTADDIAMVFAAAQVVGVGSCKAMECGKFNVAELTVSD